MLLAARRGMLLCCPEEPFTSSPAQFILLHRSTNAQFRSSARPQAAFQRADNSHSLHGQVKPAATGWCCYSVAMPSKGGGGKAQGGGAQQPGGGRLVFEDGDRVLDKGGASGGAAGWQQQLHGCLPDGCALPQPPVSSALTRTSYMSRSSQHCYRQLALIHTHFTISLSLSAATTLSMCLFVPSSA